MRQDWKYLPLGEVTSSINGLWKGKKPPFVNVGVIRNANFTKEFTLNLSNIVYLDVEERQYSTRKLQRGDLIVEKSGGSEKQPVGRTILFDLEGEYSVSNFTSILRIKDRTLILPTFLYKYLLYIYKEGYTKDMQNATTGIHNILYDKFLSIPVPIISLSEQERIVALLDTQFAKIDALKANAASQLQAAKDLFQSALKQLLTPQEGWEKKKLGECFISINNGANIKQTKGAGGIPITRIETLSNGVFNKDRLGYANIDDASRYYKYILKDGDLLMSHINSVEFVGRTVVFHNQLPIVIHGMNLLRLVPNTTAISDFYYYAFKAPWFRLQLEPIIHKSVNQASMNTTALKQVNVYIPNKDTQQEIVSRLDKISEKVKALQANYDQTINLCNDLKQALLKSIFA